MDTILEARNLKKYFKTKAGMLHAVDDVSFTIERGKTLGVVGESGCGKSTLGRTLIHLCESTDGQILFEGKDITHVTKKELFDLRADMQMIFQDPYSSLNGRMMVGQIIAEPLEISRAYSKEDKELYSRERIDDTVAELMQTVGLDLRFENAYPHELDGGRRQRIGIARALALQPKFVVCDEPVSALDVSVQAQILNLMQDLQQDKKLTYIFITHDLAVVKYIADEIMVMYLGQAVEKCGADELFRNTLHPYSKALLSAIPVPDIHCAPPKVALKGEIVSPVNPKPGCRFYSRCPHACERCLEPQTLKEVCSGHFVACCRVGEI